MEQARYLWGSVDDGDVDFLMDEFGTAGDESADACAGDFIYLRQVDEDCFGVDWEGLHVVIEEVDGIAVQVASNHCENGAALFRDCEVKFRHLEASCQTHCTGKDTHGQWRRANETQIAEDLITEELHLK